MAPSVFRFAPSPNGRLHLGHAYSALLNRHMADGEGGKLLLRIEDIDIARCTPAFEEGIYEDLHWLGVGWDRPVRRQSDHFDAYENALDQLIKDDLVYPAFMSRGEIHAHIADAEATGQRWPRDPDGVPLYPGPERAMPPSERNRRMQSGAPFAWRLNMARAQASFPRELNWLENGAGPSGETGSIKADPGAWGDVIFARRDAPTSYHLAVVVDDAIQGVTHVVRGRDLFHATSLHRLLQEMLGLPSPIYTHHALVLGPDGRKLSKSTGSTALAALREAGQTLDDIRALIGLPA